ncbi:MAG: hypothetical protein LBC59_09305 [Chitinispirillales bacterium]|jgi:tetratricopeptide (TPR) repeat protein|nr:hypothetical protein [Chitinispirillales bacterium]
MGSKRQSQAIRELEQKLAGNPKSRAFSRLADLYRESGDLKGAVELCRAGLNEHPDYVTGRLVLARCYKEQGNLAAAADESMKVCTADIRNPVALRMMADIYLASGRAAAAGSLYAILSDMEPDNAELRVCAAKNKQRERGTAAEILGIKPVMIAPPPASRAQTAASAPDGGSLESQIESQLDSLFSDKAKAQQEGKAGGGADLDAMFLTPPEPPQGFDEGIGELNEAFGGAEGQAMPMPMPMPMPPPPPPPQMQMPPPPPPPPMQMSPPPPMSAPPPAAGPDGSQPSGDDVAGQLEAMFGGEAQSESVPTNDVVVGTAPPPDSQISGDDVAGQLDSLFGGAEAEMLAESEMAEGAALAEQPVLDEDSIMMDESALQAMGADGEGADDQLSGDDLAGRLDAMFGEPGPESQASGDEQLAVDGSVLTDESGLTEESVLAAMGDGQDGHPSGDDVAGQLDTMFGGAAPAPSVPQDESVLTDGSGLTEESVLAAMGGGQDGHPSGDDVAGQLDTMFGGASPSVPADESLLTGGSVLTGEPEPTGMSMLTDDSALSAADGGGYSSGNAVVDQLDALFGGASVLSVDVPASAPIDISPMAPGDGEGAEADQLDQLFGGQSVLSADDIPDSASVDLSLAAPSGEAEADQLDELFGGQSVLSADDIPDSASVDLSPMAPSGNAVVDQLDELFGGQTVLPPAAMPAGDTSAALGEDVPSGNAVADRLDALFGGTLPPAAVPEDMAGAAQDLNIADDATKELDLPASPEIDAAMAEISGDDIENKLDVMFGTAPAAAEADEAALSAALEAETATPPADLQASSEEADEAALAAALEAEQTSVSGDDVENRLSAMFDAAAAPPPDIPDEPALVVDGNDAAPADEAAPPDTDTDAKTAGKLPSSIILDENGVDIAMAAPTSDDIEDRIDTMFGKSDPSMPKEPLVIDEDEAKAKAETEAAKTTEAPTDSIPVDASAAGEIDGADMTGDDVEARLAEMFGGDESDTTTAMALEEVMGVDIDGVDKVDGAYDADVVIGTDTAVDGIDTDSVISADGVVNVDDLVSADDAVGADGIVEVDSVDGLNLAQSPEPPETVIEQSQNDLTPDDTDNTVGAVDTAEDLLGVGDVVQIEDVVSADNAVGADGVVEVVDMNELLGIEKTDEVDNAIGMEPDITDDVVSIQDVVNASNEVDPNAVVDVFDMENFVGVKKTGEVDILSDTDDASGTVIDGVIDISNISDTVDNSVIDTDNVPVPVTDTVVDGVVDISNIIDTVDDTNNVIDTDSVVDISEFVGEDQVVEPVEDLLGIGDVINIDGIAGTDSVIDAGKFKDMDDEILAAGKINDMDDEILAAGKINDMDDEILAAGKFKDMDDEILASGKFKDMDDEILAAGKIKDMGDEILAAGKFKDMDDEILAAGKIKDMDDEILAVGKYKDMDDEIRAGKFTDKGASDPSVGAEDDIEDRLRQLFMTEGADPEPRLGSGLDSLDDAGGADVLSVAHSGGGGEVSGGAGAIGPDERDTPFDLPDHVLTSTLADIYYQQGQPRLALHIYERLMLRDPEDKRLLAKISEIKGVLQQLGEGGTAAPAVAAVRPEKAPSASSGRKKKAPAAEGRATDSRPLAGVRIKKSAPAKKGGKRAKPKP